MRWERLVTYVYIYDSYVCVKKREREERLERAIFNKHTHKTHTSTTLQMKSKVAYIVSDMSLKGFLMGFVMDLVYMGLRLLHDLCNISLTKSIAHLLN